MVDDLTSGIEKAERVATAVDAAVEPAADEGNRVLPDNARLVRWAGPLFGLCAVVLIPWIVITSLVLPSRQVSENFDVAWAGYDVGLFISLLSTAVCALKRSRYLTIAASVTGALLLADAWFDVLTAPSGWDLVQSIAMSALVELPLASLCFWLGLHSQDVTDRRILLLTMRQRGEHRGRVRSKSVGPS
jgi:hypothetical protein